MKKIKLTYFKDSGKYYSDGEYESEHEFDFNIYKEVMEWANGSLTFEHLPGLSSRVWWGYILVQSDDGVPAIIDVTEEKSK